MAEGQDVSGRHKSEYAAANIIDMGGLVSGGAGFMADGARWLGMDGVADGLTFSTSDIAQSLDNGVSSVKEFLTRVAIARSTQYAQVRNKLQKQLKTWIVLFSP